jgi:hypothetical protein
MLVQTATNIHNDNVVNQPGTTITTMTTTTTTDTEENNDTGKDRKQTELKEKRRIKCQAYQDLVALRRQTSKTTKVLVDGDNGGDDDVDDDGETELRPKNHYGDVAIIVKK